MEVDEPASADTSAAHGDKGKSNKSSKQLCEDYGITDVEFEYTPEDFQNLITYKLFNQHIRPMILEKNPKLVMYKMVSLIGAKWREFGELKEKYNKEHQSDKKSSNGDEQNNDSDEEGAEPATLKSLLEETVGKSAAADVVAAANPTGKGKRGGPGRGKQKAANQSLAADDADTSAIDKDEIIENKRASGRPKRSATTNAKYKATEDDEPSPAPPQHAVIAEAKLDAAKRTSSGRIVKKKRKRDVIY